MSDLHDNPDDSCRRSIRSTAGNRYQALLACEDQDDFYNNHYGGFFDLQADDDFRSGKDLK